MKELLEATNGKIFRVQFVKKTTGEVRTMVCRLGVYSYLKGGELKYNPAEKNNLIVFDMQKRAYRTIALDNLMSFKCGAAAWTNAAMVA